MVRNAVRALIVEDDKLLFIKKERPNIGIYYVLPGGAQEPNETLGQSLKRECLEELGLNIIDSKLVCIREYISQNHEYSLIMKEVHAIDFMYTCIPDSNKILNGLQADIGQIGIEWLPIAKIKHSLIQKDIKHRTYHFPRTTHDFLREFLFEEIRENYLSRDFRS